MLITETLSRNDIADGSDDEGFRIDVLGSGLSQPTRPIILDDTFFRIVPTLGPLHAHHLLVCSRRDRSGVHQMHAAELLRLQSILASVERVYSRIHGKNFVMFENGTRGTGLSGCSIRHFHFHVVPTARTFNERPNSGGGFHIVESLPAAQRRATLLGDYQLMKIPDGPFLIRSRGELPSQYLRRRVAELNGITEWDWRKFKKTVDWSQHSAAYASLRSALVRDVSANASH